MKTNNNSGSHYKTYTNLVHDSDARILSLLIKLHHSRGDVASGHDILLVANGGLDYIGMENVRDQADNKIMLGDSSIQSSGVSDIERDSLCELNTLRELLGAVKTSAGYIWLCQLNHVKLYIHPPNDSPTVTSTPASLRTSSVGLATKPEPLE